MILPLIPELLHVICENLRGDKYTLAQLVRTCRALEYPATEVLWSTFDEPNELIPIEGILDLLGLTEDECERAFVKRYARHVQRFAFPSSLTEEIRIGTALRNRSSVIPTTVIFPNIQVLKWRGSHYGFNTISQHFDRFLGPNLVDFDFDVIYREDRSDEAPHLALITKLREQYPSMKSFRFIWDDPFPDDIETKMVAEISSAIISWLHLETLSVSDITYAALVAVSTLPHLRTLKALCTEYPNILQTTGDVVRGFRSLTYLAFVMESDMNEVFAVLDLLNSPPLETITLCSRIPRVGTSSFWKQVFTSIRDHCQVDTLRSLSVRDMFDCVVGDLAGTGGGRLNFEALTPLLDFYNIQHFHMDVTLGFYQSLNSTALAKMASKWRDIEVLKFTSPPSLQGTFDGHAQMNLSDLMNFAGMCPKLEELAMFLDSEDIPRSVYSSHVSSEIRNCALKMLMVVDDASEDDYNAMRSYLSNVFPGFKCIVVVDYSGYGQVFSDTGCRNNVMVRDIPDLSRSLGKIRAPDEIVDRQWKSLELIY